jgi:hypothetical protein
MNSYLTLKEKHQKEFSDFPIFFAFSNEQFERGMKKFGLNPDDTDKIYSLSGTGGYYLRSDAEALHDMFDRHERERQEAIEADTTGEGYIFDMFNYELANHEYGYTGSVTDTLDALGLTIDDINNNPLFVKALNKARKIQWENN